MRLWTQPFPRQSQQTAYLGLGANLGDRAANMRDALKRIDGDACRVTAISSLYAAAPVGVEDQPEFLNAVVQIETALPPTDLLALCGSIELEMGRERTIRWGPRVMDIDILLYNDVTLESEDLTIPHPRMMERAFVLAPLAEIAPDVELPGGVSAAEAAGSIDRSGVRVIQDRSWST